MLSVLGITFPIFAAILLGYLLVRFNVFKPDGMRAFGIYVLQVALPALIFQAVAKRDLHEVFNLPYMSVYLLGGLITVVVAFVWFSAVTGPMRRAVAVMGSSCPNSGFVGFPLMVIVMPDLAGLVLAMNFLIENVIIIPICLVLIDLARGGEQRLAAKLGRVFLNVLKRPFVIGLILGLVFSGFGLTLPGPADRFLTLFAQSAAALALLVIGGSLAGIPLKGNIGLAAQIASGKLILQPVATYVAMVLLGGAGLVLTGDLRTAVILTAALPAFTIYVAFAQEAGHEALASLAVLGSTLGAFVTLNLLIYFFA